MKIHKDTLKKSFIASLIIIFSVALYSSAVLAPERFNAVPKKTISLEEILQILPVESVKESLVQNSWATAIFLPQTHQQPGSSAKSLVNDEAELVQNQIYEVLSYLSQSGTESEEIKSLISNPEDYGHFSNSADAYLSLLDREITLAGAASMLKAKNEHVCLYGSEVKKTQDESAEIVRNYIYLEDRKDQLSGNSSKNSALSALQIIGGFQDTPEKSLENDIHLMLSCPNFTLRQEAGELEQMYGKIEGLRSNKTVSSNPKRTDNPYKNIYSIDKIDLLLSETESDINNVVVVKRNKETAENFARALKENDLNEGIIQFGAGHEEGLVEELNKLGISVITVKVKGGKQN